MKKNILSRLLATSLTLALLLPCLTFAPAKANNWAIEMWKWEFGPTYNEGILQSYASMFNSNIINETSTRANGFGVNSSTMYGVNGPYNKNSFFFRTTAGVSGGKHYGLPYTTVGKYTKVAEGLSYELAKDEHLYTRGLVAMNVDFTFAFHADTYFANEIAFSRQLEVYVAVNGGDYLPDSVGVRSSKLLAGGFTHGTTQGAVFEIQTENLFDIEGFEPGMTVTGIKVRPMGDGPVSGGHIITDVTINGYETLADWEACVPAENRQTVTVDPKVLRQIAVDEGVRTAMVPWTTDTIIDVINPGGASGVATTMSKRQYIPGVEYHGPVYARIIDATREQLFASIVDGKYGAGDGGYATDIVVGMDCQTFAFNVISRVSRSGASACANAFIAPKTTLLGNLKTSDFIPSFTDVHIIDLNDAQTVYEAYAQLQAGDVLDSCRSNESNYIHIRIVRETVIVRNPDGTIDPNKSYVGCVESNAEVLYDIKLADGSVTTLSASNSQTLYEFMERYPDAEILFGRTAEADSEYTFANLRDTKYVPLTLDEYADGVVELADVEMIFAPMAANSNFWQSGLHLTAASNYRIVARTVKLEDKATGEVLFLDDTFLSSTPCSSFINYENEELNTLMKSLSNGDYRLSVGIHSGPLTAIGQTQVPITTETVDFTVTDKKPTASVTLSTPGSASAGKNVQVLVKTGSAFDGADVEVKFDTELLTFVDGTLSPANAFGQITADKGILRIMAVDAGVTSAGQLAVLNFTAKSDIASVSKAIQVKSAQLVTAADATTSVANKALDATEACASINFADVAQSAWYHDAVDYALNNSIMGGYNATTFGPNDTLTRAMVVQVLYNKEGQPAINGSHKFPDVKSGDWFNNAVTWANINKVVGGYGDGRFGPNDKVTLEQIAVILWNYSGNPTPTGDASSLGAHSNWAANALSWAAAKGIFQNVPYEAVTGTATRAQTAQMLMNYLSK